MLLVGAAGFLVWSAVLLATPGGSHSIEPVQALISAATAAYAVYALRKRDPVHNRRCRYILLAFAISGVVIVFGLSADRSTSRTWARLGWAALAFGYLGSLIVWLAIPKARVASIGGAIVGAVLIAAGVGLTINCDPSIQRTWCNPDFEREQALAEQIEVVGEFERSGRTSGSLGPALVTYFVAEGTSITGATDPPGEWEYEERPTESIEIERGRYATEDPRFADCRLDVKLESVPQGIRESVFVTCGLEA